MVWPVHHLHACVTHSAAEGQEAETLKSWTALTGDFQLAAEIPVVEGGISGLAALDL